MSLRTSFRSGIFGIRSASYYFTPRAVIQIADTVTRCTNAIRAAATVFFISGFLACASGCDQSVMVEPPEPANIVTNLTSRYNPTGYAPLTAEISLTTTRPVQVELLIEGRTNPAGDVRHRFPEIDTEFTLPVLGLYPSATNTVYVRFFDENESFLGEVTHEITTQPLSSDMPRVTIDKIVPADMKPGMNLVGYFGHNSEFLPQRPLMFDATGAIRWYVDFSDHPTLSNLFYDAGIERLANGNLYCGDGSTGRIIEFDMLGRLINEWPIPGYGFHHHVLELPNGNLLATVNKHGLRTIEDHIIEIDRGSGAIVQVWDLNQLLDNKRRIWSGNVRDWFHGNGLAYDPSDDTIIVSGRVQGTVKLTRDNEIVWLLAPHRGWGTAGNGADLNTFLLQPLDASGQPITDPAVLDGSENHADFEWAWYQHAPELMSDGTLLLFDNGDNRNFRGAGPYSRAVQYRIDADAMTVQQIWQYGKERGRETFASIVSDVDYHAEEDNVVFNPGFSHDSRGAYGKTVEVDYASRNVVFEATIRPPEAFGGITFHRVERLSLYP